MSLSLRFWAGHEASTTRGQQAGGVGMDLGKVMLIAYIPVPIFVFLIIWNKLLYSRRDIIVIIIISNFFWGFFNLRFQGLHHRTGLATPVPNRWGRVDFSLGLWCSFGGFPSRCPGLRNLFQSRFWQSGSCFTHFFKSNFND